MHQAVRTAAHEYIAARRERIAPFCAEHFSVAGAWRINRKALGKDLVRTPANILLAPPYLLSRLVLPLSRAIHWRRGEAWLRRLPPGFKTDVQREIEWLIYTEWLELPYARGARRSTRDAFLERILSQPAIAGLLLPELQKIDALARNERFRERLVEFLSEYTASRTAAAELAGAVLNLAAGAAAFQQFTPGSFALGQAAAAAIAQHVAIANFVLGPTLGSLYYGLFPAAVSQSLLVSTIGSLMLAVGVLSALAGVVTDPLQQALGLQRRKLRKLLDSLEQQLTGEGGDFRLHDAYAARVFDILDLLRSLSRQLA